MWLFEHDGPVITLAARNQTGGRDCQAPLIDYQYQMRTRLTEGSWNTNDQSFSRDGFTQVDFIAR
jgi:hypothetical protein